MCAATGGKGTNPAGVRDFSWLATSQYQIFAANRAPGHAGSAATSPAIDAMTVSQGEWRRFQYVAGATAKTSARNLHEISLTDRSFVVDFTNRAAFRKSAFLIQPKRVESKVPEVSQWKEQPCPYPDVNLLSSLAPARPAHS